jgi:hypothetical protein
MNWLTTLVLGRPKTDMAALRRAAEATRKAWAEAELQARGTAGRA